MLVVSGGGLNYHHHAQLASFSPFSAPKRTEKAIIQP